MFILVNPDTNVLIKISENCIPIIINKGEHIQCEEDKATSYLLDGLIYPKTLPAKVYEVSYIPEQVVPYKYLYTEKDGFVINTNYQEPEDIYSSLDSMETQISNIKTNITQLDEYNVKTNISKMLNTILYLGNNRNYFIDKNGNASFNTISVSNKPSFEDDATFKSDVYFSDSKKYYIYDNGNARFNELILNKLCIGESGTLTKDPTTNKEVFVPTYYIDKNANAVLNTLNTKGEANLSSLKVSGTSTLTGNTTIKSNLYLNSTTYYLNNTGSANLNELNVAGKSSFTGNTTFKNNVYFANGTTYYINSSGSANLNSLSLANTLSVAKSSTFTGNVTFKSNVYFANGVAYYINSGGTASLAGTTVATIKIGYNNVTTSYSYLYHTLCLGSSSSYWINQNGNVKFKGATFTGEVVVSNAFTAGPVTIKGGNGASHLGGVLNMGNSTAPDGLRYYINDNATGRFYYLRSFGNAIFYDDIIYHKKLSNSSSRRYKENILYKDSGYWHDKLMQVKPCEFNYINRKDEKRIGVIAEDLVDNMPELVTHNEEGKCEGVSYVDFVVPLISEAQRTNKIIEEMQEKINRLESIIEKCNINT